MSIQSYKDLDFWKRSCAVVTDIYRVTQPFPKTEMFGLTGVGTGYDTVGEFTPP